MNQANPERTMGMMRNTMQLRGFVAGLATGIAAVLLVSRTVAQHGDGNKAVQPKPGEVTPNRVTGIGGVFFRAKDPKGLVEWYRTNLGIDTKGGFADFRWRELDAPQEVGHTTWRIFPSKNLYFGESASQWMINYRVADLERMLEQLRKAGVKIEKSEDHDFGGWAWITDPEGNRIELWEPREK